ncbi:MAG: response regulator transcription factor [Saprospiraceae bacterium]|nr:response regulator transcription factor [Saprospiraceae bacterium]
MFKALIIEDEPNGLANLKSILAESCPSVNVVAEATTIGQALSLIKNDKISIDVAFLDINLPDGLVFSFLNNLDDIYFEIIFVTAYEEHAIQACKYASIGYILKPIDSDELVEAVSRINPNRNNHTKERLDIFHKAYNGTNQFKKMPISALDGIYFVNVSDIVRLEGDNNYTNIFFNKGEKITTSKTIKSYEEILGGVNFFRVHKEHIINLNYIEKFIKGDGGYIILEGGKKIEVSRRKKPAFLEHMKKLKSQM